MLNFNEINLQLVEFNGNDVKLIYFKDESQAGQAETCIWAKPMGVLYTTVNGAYETLTQTAYRSYSNEPNAFLGWLTTGEGGTPVYYHDSITLYEGTDPNYDYPLNAGGDIIITQLNQIAILTANIPLILQIKAYATINSSGYVNLFFKGYANKNQLFTFKIYDQYNNVFITDAQQNFLKDENIEFNIHVGQNEQPYYYVCITDDNIERLLLVNLDNTINWDDLSYTKLEF